MATKTTKTTKAKADATEPKAIAIEAVPTPANKAKGKGDKGKTPTATEKEDAPGRDKFGCRDGSQAATINACLSTKPKDAAAIIEQSQLNGSRVRAHLKFLVEKGLVTETKDGFAVKAKAKGK